MSKKSFILYTDSLCVLEDLDDKQRGQLFYAIYKHQIGETIDMSPIIRIAFSQFKNQFQRDEEKYQNTCNARKEAGAKGGKQRVANQANACKSNQELANQADNDNVNDSDSDTVNDNEKDSNNDTFSFSLSRLYSYSNVTKEYKERLKAKIESENKGISYQDFVMQLGAKDYKYKDFWLAYQSWCRKIIKPTEEVKVKRYV